MGKREAIILSSEDFSRIWAMAMASAVADGHDPTFIIDTEDTIARVFAAAQMYRKLMKGAEGPEGLRVLGLSSVLRRTIRPGGQEVFTLEQDAGLYNIPEFHFARMDAMRRGRGEE